jgi:hypothetical protein
MSFQGEKREERVERDTRKKEVSHVRGGEYYDDRVE